MFRKKKSTPSKDSSQKDELAGMLGGLGMDPSEMQFGIGIGDDDGDDDDASLEAELAALQGGHGKPARKKKKNLSSTWLKFFKKSEAELQCIAPGEDVLPKDPTPVLSPSKQEANTSPQLAELTERENMYKKAIDSAEKSGNSSKAKRYGRGLKQIQDMVKQANAGESVNMEELPPPVAISAAAVPTAAPQEATPSPEPPKLSVLKESPKQDTQMQVDKSQSTQAKSAGGETVEQLKQRQHQYKMAALTCKRAGDIAHAKEFLVVSKKIDVMIQASSDGKPVDLSNMPPEPSLSTASAPQPVSEPRQQSGSPTSSPQPGPSESSKDTEPPPPPKDVADALQQRLEKYTEAANKAKEEGNSSKARRMGRIVKQYEDAIKCHKAGKPVDYEELPAPPGFAPIPVPGHGGAAASSQVPASPASTSSTSSQAQGLKVQIPPPQASPQAPARKPSGRNEQQLNFLVERQKEFKMAALNAKREGDLESARHWLRMSKGLDPMIENASNGMRVDISSVPPSPNSEKGPAPTAKEGDFVVVETSECRPNPRTPEEVTELFSRLEDGLIKQVEMCIRNGKHYQKLGDINNTKMFEKMARSLQQDLDAVKNAKKHKDPPPRFHYEDKSFTIVNSFPELSDSHVEITIVRCLNIPLPSGYSQKDLHCYVTYEFPYPSSEDPQSGRTQTIKHTINPEYNEAFKVNIDRKNRALPRIFRRQALKFEIKYERGFLKGDKALGQAQVKLAPLDSKSEIHDCVDLMDSDRGRRAVGGKVEVIIRVREPLTDKDVSIEKWKWLVIDMHLGGRKGPELNLDAFATSSRPGRSEQSEIDEFVSVEVLRMETEIAERKLSAKQSGSSSAAALAERIKLCKQKRESLDRMLANASKAELQDYVRQVAGQIAREQNKAQRAVQAGNKTDAQVCLTRKKLMQNELVKLKPKLGI
ncbi:predicted protein [Nematostella vectensis]|uniref:C2 domain-containing protein n=1 Tax=Nematostella vectensis TaxID=45351 RepID=A7S4P7_NEMVE|nr:predicted protein [Nematostella vectensis]|eukprot:XP_001633387.1 predicted protein [Nematostella vectensis]